MKLVRDKIPLIIKKQNRVCSFHLANKLKKENWGCSEYGHRLIDKLHEELDEFAESFSLEEAADIYEVYLAILKNWEYSLSEVRAAARAKSGEKGKFKKGIVLENYQERN